MHQFLGAQLLQRAKYSSQIIKIKKFLHTQNLDSVFSYLPLYVKIGLLWDGFQNTCEDTQHLLSKP